MTAGLMETARRGEDIVLTAAGAWTIQAAGALDEQLRKLAAAGAKKVLIVLADLTALDTAGAWLIARTERELRRGRDRRRHRRRQARPPGAAGPHHGGRPAAAAGAGAALQSDRHRGRPGRGGFRCGPPGAQPAQLLRRHHLRRGAGAPAPQPNSHHLAGESRRSSTASTRCRSSACCSFLVGVVHGLSGRRPAAPVRRRDLHRQPGRHLRPARDGHPADRDRHRRPLGQRLHRADRHDAGQRGGRRACARSGSTRSRCWCCRACSR